MCENKVLNVVNDENGYMIIRIAGKEFISTEPIPVLNGKFRAKDLMNMVFEEA